MEPMMVPSQLEPTARDGGYVLGLQYIHELEAKRDPAGLGTCWAWGARVGVGSNSGQLSREQGWHLGRGIVSELLTVPHSTGWL